MKTPIMEWMRTGLPDWHRGTTWCVPHILELPADGGAQCAEGCWSLLSCCGQSLWCLLIADKDIQVISFTQTVNTHETTNSWRHNKEFTASTHPFSAPSLSWSNWFIIHEDVEAECKVISSLNVTREDWRPLELSPHPLLSPGASAQAQVSDIHARVNLEVSVLGWFKFVFTCVTGAEAIKLILFNINHFYAVTNYFTANWTQMFNACATRVFWN